MKLLKTDAMRNCIYLFAFGISAGFIAGCGMAAYTVFVRHYLRHELYYLSAGIVKQSLVTGIVTACVVCAICIVLAGLAQALAFFMCSPEQRPARAKLLSVVFIGLAVCVWGIYTVDFYRAFIAVGRFHFRTLAWHAGIILCGFLSGWLFYRYGFWKRVLRIGSACRIPAVLALVLAGILSGGFYVYETWIVPEKPNVILISIDALRADHVGCYGYHRNTTPHIDAFAQEGVMFLNAFCHEPWTLPSHMSMLTGLYTTTHGVYHWRPLNPRIITLTEYLKNAGYATLASANSYWMLPLVGFGKGFDKYMLVQKEDILDGSVRVAEYQNKQMIEQLKKQSEPFFAFIHYYDVHSNFEKLPYDAPPPFNQQFTSIGEDEFPFRVPGVYASEYLQYINQNKIVLSESERQLTIDLYDNGIAYMDYAIGQFFESLKSLGLYDNTVIIITADHGEAFQEHGWMLKSNPYYYDGVMRVPLIVKLPQGAPSPVTNNIDSLIELIDIKPSILDYVGIEPIFVQGESFMDLIAGSSEGKEAVYGLASTGSLFVRTKKWKLMSDDGLNRNRYRLYDIEHDPGEQHNVALEYPEIEEYLEGKLRKRIEESLELRARMVGARGVAQDDAPTRQFRLDAEQEERLRSLGYVL